MIVRVVVLAAVPDPEHVRMTVRVVVLALAAVLNKGYLQ